MLKKSFYILIIFIVLMPTFCGMMPTKIHTDNKNISKLEKLMKIDNEYIDRLSITYHDLDLTQEELDAVKKYQESGLKVGQYLYNYFYEETYIEGHRYSYGMNKYLMEYLSKVFDIKMNYTSVSFSEVLNKIIFKSIDVVPSLVVTDKRDEYIDFSKKIIPTTHYVYSYNKYNDIKALSNHTIAKIGDGIWITESDQKKYNITIVKTEYDKAFEELKEGKFDAVVYSFDPNFLNADIDFFKYGQLSKEKLVAFGMIEGDDDLKHLTAAFAKALEKEINSLLSEYLFHHVKILILLDKYFTDEEREFIEGTKHRPITLINPIHTYDDYEKNIKRFLNEGEVAFKQISEIIGWNYEIIENGMDYTKLFKNLKQNPNTIDYDGLLYSQFVEEKAEGNYLAAYDNSKVVIVGERDKEVILDKENLPFYTIGMVEDAFYVDYFESKYTANNFKYYKSFGDVIKAYKNGQISHFVLNSGETVVDFDKYYGINSLEIKYTSDLVYELAPLLAGNDRGDTIRRIYMKVAMVRPTQNFSDIKKWADTYIQLQKITKENNKRNLTYALIVVFFLSSFILYLFNSIKKKEEIARIDKLTGLFNRKGLFDAYAKKELRGKDIILFDANKFKEVNDLFGHNVGDEVLKTMAQRLKNTNGIENVYRLGGDEFVIIADNFDLELSQVVINEVKRAIVLDNGINIDGLGCSLGVVKAKDNWFNDLSDILNFADLLMYKAKEKKDAYAIFSSKKLLEEFDIKNKIEKFIFDNDDSDKIQPFYQPIYNVESHEITGFEALVRLKYEGKIYTPDYIIPAYRKADKLYKLDFIMFEKAVEMLSKIIKSNEYSSDLYISVNFMPTSFMHYSEKDFEEIADKYDVDRKNILIEILESETLVYEEIKIIKQIVDSGFRIAIDDFSEGHTSFKSLMAFKRNTIIKIDRGMIMLLSRLLETTENIYKEMEYEIFKSFTKMIRDFNLDIIVEGVESKEGLQLIKELGIKYVQGFYFSRPMPEENIFQKYIKK